MLLLLLQLTLVHMYTLKSLGPGRLLATFLSLLPLSLRPLMFENVSPLSQFSSGLVVAVDGVVVVVAEDGMMVR